MLSITLSAATFIDLASAGAFASTDKARPLLTGVLLVPTGGIVKAIATDSYKLVTITRELVELTGDAAPTLVPADVLAKAAKDAAKSRVNVEITADAKAGSFTIASMSGAWTYGGRLVEGNYPDVETLIPAANGITCPEGEIVAFNVFFLADVTKVAPWSTLKGREKNGTDAAMRITALNDRKRPIRIESRDGQTIVLVMPVRV